MASSIWVRFAARDIPFVVEACAAVARGEADALLRRNIGQVDAACEAAVAWEVAPPLNVWNAQTARVLTGFGRSSYLVARGAFR